MRSANAETKNEENVPRRSLFVYFRVYGPEKAAFDGTWKPGDFAIVQ
jgi:hypothetical protein